MTAAFDALRANYPKVAKDLFGPLLQLLFVARSVGDGDMDKVVILAVLSARAAEHPDYANVTYDDLESGRAAELVRPTNLSSLAASSGIPKETARRKVADLVKMGLIERRGRNLACTPATFQALAPARAAILRQAVANHQTVVRCLSPGPDEAGNSRSATPPS
jgi:hypothetical protein